MNIRELSKEELLATLGLQPRRTTMDYLLPALGLFGAGLLIGASVGVLFAPKSGEQLRSDLGQRVREMGGARPEDVPPGMQNPPH